MQAPSDSTLGTVNVVVDNNGVFSAPVQVQLQSYAPAFFLDPGTNAAIASLLPNYNVVGTATAPAHPGDTLVLWGTGFGPTTPPAPAGTKVSGIASTPRPVVTVGGTPVTVIGSVLTPGTAGVYQIAIQLPTNMFTGTLAIQATIGGSQTQYGTTLLVAAQ